MTAGEARSAGDRWDVQAARRAYQQARQLGDSEAEVTALIRLFDGIVNAVGKGGRRSGELVYKYIDQGLVDGAVNGSGATARGAGGALQPVQSGKVDLYGALLFGAAAVGALVLVLVNS